MPYDPIHTAGEPVATLVPALAGYRIKASRMFLVSSAATIIQFASGATTITGPCELAAKGAFVLDDTFFITEPGEALNLAQTGAAVFGGAMFWEYIPATRPISV